MIEPKTMTDLARTYSTITALNLKVRQIAGDHFLEARLVLSLGFNLKSAVPILSEMLLSIVYKLAEVSGEVDRFAHDEIRQQVHRLDRILNERT